jgi:TPR repeat protein
MKKLSNMAVVIAVLVLSSSIFLTFADDDVTKLIGDDAAQEMNYDKLYDKAFDYYDKGDYINALLVFNEAFKLDRTITDAPYMIGFCYYKLNNFEKAKEWFTYAGDRGDVGANYYLGLMYEEGKGVEANPNKALSYYEKAEGSNKKAAQRAEVLRNASKSSALERETERNIADGSVQDVAAIREAMARKKQIEEQNARVNGTVPLPVETQPENADPNIRAAEAYKKQNNFSAAIIEYEKAANNGSIEAMLILGDMYRDGCGVNVEDFKKAGEWYSMALNKGCSDAAIRLGDLEKKKGSEMKAWEWYENAAKNGNAEGQALMAQRAFEAAQKAHLGSFERENRMKVVNDWLAKALATDPDNQRANYYQGRILYEELECWKAIAYFKKATFMADDAISHEANYFAGLCNEQLSNFGDAYTFLAAATNARYAPAIGAMARCYYEGNGVVNFEKNETMAKKYATEASALGDPEGLYYNSKLNSGKLADKYLKESAEAGYAQAQFEMGMKESSVVESQKWFHKAAAQGHKGAQDRLSSM